MVKLVDARDLKSLDRKVVPVQFRLRAPIIFIENPHFERGAGFFIPDKLIFFHCENADGSDQNC